MGDNWGGGFSTVVLRTPKGRALASKAALAALVASAYSSRAPVAAAWLGASAIVLALAVAAVVAVAAATVVEGCGGVAGLADSCPGGASHPSAEATLPRGDAVGRVSRLGAGKLID